MQAKRYFHPVFMPLAAAAALALLSAPATAGAWSTASEWGNEAADQFRLVRDQGSTDLYLAGYARHGRNTYTKDRLEELNEKAWGVGVGRRLRNARGNDEIIYALGISDSHFKPQLMAGYAHEWIYPMGGSGLELGVGYTAMLMSRRDYFGGFPFPIALPVGSVGTRDIKLRASYVPRLSQKKGNGDVLLLFVSMGI
jgi:lipid IVA palmitoyltransferase